MKKGIVITALVMGAMCMHIDYAKGAEPVIANGKTVSFDYTLTVDGKQVDSSVGKKPLEYIQGEHAIVPGLEKQLEGLKKGDKKTVVVTPEEGYGAVKTDALREVPKTQLPPDAPVAVGTVLAVRTPTGAAMPVKIVEVKDTAVMIDFNHPLAGKELHFDITVVDVK